MSPSMGAAFSSLPDPTSPALSASRNPSAALARRRSRWLSSLPPASSDKSEPKRSAWTTAFPPFKSSLKSSSAMSGKVPGSKSRERTEITRARSLVTPMRLSSLCFSWYATRSEGSSSAGLRRRREWALSKEVPSGRTSPSASSPKVRALTRWASHVSKTSLQVSSLLLPSFQKCSLTYSTNLPVMSAQPSSTAPDSGLALMSYRERALRFARSFRAK
mmetsp:Transcript_47888/g.108666  ORF Transcript_47888/g.108666 Transcript_47888/m.108666 type:complete len:218 (-) Transcript_47888:2433-3086(-)